MDTPNYKELYTEYKDKNYQLMSDMVDSEFTDFYSFVIDKDHMNENNNLYLLFVTGKLLEKSTILEIPKAQISQPLKRSRSESERVVIPTKITRYNDYISNLTPYLKAYITPAKFARYSHDLDQDDTIIKRLENVIDNSEYVDKQNYGKLVEVWFADNCNCPVCNQPTLRRYAKDNFPVIDLVCINPLHTFEQGVKFFQIKSTSTNFNDFKYFDYDDRLIHTGSYKFGKIVHSINVLDDDITKKVLIGYICITVEPRKDHLKINKDKSFYVLPKTNINVVAKKLFEDNFDTFFVQYDNNDIVDKYYEYVDIVRPMITFSTTNNDVTKFSIFYPKTKTMTIPMNYLTDGKTSWSVMNNTLFE